MTTILGFSIVFLAALIHASFQLSVGCLVLLFHRGLSGAKTKHHIKDMAGSFISGAGLTVFLTISTLGFWLVQAFGWEVPLQVWIAEVYLAAALGLALLLIYYRHSKTTELYLPRSLAKFLTQQIKKTSNNHEAFVFGVAGVIGELPFVVVLTLIGASGLIELDDVWRPLAAILYTVVTILPLVIMSFMLKNRHTISEIQKWRLHNKNFLKITGGLSAFVLGAYLLAFKIMPLIGG